MCTRRSLSRGSSGARTLSGSPTSVASCTCNRGRAFCRLSTCPGCAPAAKSIRTKHSHGLCACRTGSSCVAFAAAGWRSFWRSILISSSASQATVSLMIASTNKRWSNFSGASRNFLKLSVPFPNHGDLCGASCSASACSSQRKPYACRSSRSTIDWQGEVESIGRDASMGDELALTLCLTSCRRGGDLVRF